jgi:tRNA A37 threonylcarbamoyladenosine dehydratase
MHLGDVANKNMNNPSELQATDVRKSFMEHLVAFLKKTLKKPA